MGGRQNVKVLLISNTLDIYYQTQKVMGNQNELQMLSFEAFKDVETIECDILVINFECAMVTTKEFKIILEAKCKSNVPILALLESSSISDQFEVLSVGALDYLECPVADEVYEQKLNEMSKWKRYYDWEEMKRQL